MARRVVYICQIFFEKKNHKFPILSPVIQECGFLRLKFFLIHFRVFFSWHMQAKLKLFSASRNFWISIF